MSKTAFPLLAALVLSGCTYQTAERQEPEDPAIAKALAGRVAGKPVACLSTSDMQDMTSYRGAILYRVGRTVYRNDMDQCPILGSDTIMVNRVYGSQICRGDIVHFVERTGGFMRGACGYGDFVPYTKVAAAGPARWR